MKRTELTPKQKAVDDVLSFAMAMAHQMETGQPYDELQKRFLRATRRLKRRSREWAGGVQQGKYETRTTIR